MRMICVTRARGTGRRYRCCLVRGYAARRHPQIRRRRRRSWRVAECCERTRDVDTTPSGTTTTEVLIPCDEYLVQVRRKYL